MNHQSFEQRRVVQLFAAAVASALVTADNAFAGTTFLNHFDTPDPVSGGAGPADFAAGDPNANPEFFGVGGQIVSSPAKFGNSLLRTDGLTVGGRVRYQIANNWDVNKGTIEMWIRGDGIVGGFSGGGFQGLMGTDTNSGSGDVRFYIYDTPAGRTLGGYQLGGGGSFWEIEQVIPAAGLNNNQWHHVAWGFDTVAGITATWWDGQLLRNTPDAGTVNPRTSLGATRFHIGENQGGSAPFRGNIDEFRISDTIVYPVNGNFTPPTAPFTVGPVGSAWAVNASGTWLSAGNWTAGAPNASGASAILGSVITSPQTVTLDAGVTIGSLQFDNDNAYTISGTSTLTLQSGSAASIQVARGSHSINTPLALGSSTTVTVSAAGSVLTLAGGMSASSGATLTKAGAGTVRAARIQAEALSIEGGKVEIIASGTSGAATGTSRVNSLSIAGGAKLDLSNNGMVVDYSGASPYGAIRSLVNLGAAGTEGIYSSVSATDTRKAVGYAEASSLGISTFLGQSVDAEAIVLRLTLKGDSDLNGIVNFADLLTLAQNYNLTGDWRQGDANYDGVIAFDDLLSLAQNYGGSLSLVELSGFSNSFQSDLKLALSMAPEPAAGALAALSVGALGRRRRSV